MYNFSGIWFRIWGVCGIIFLIGIVILLIEKPWKKFDLKRCILGLFITFFAICLSLIYLSKIVFPDISSYTGEFVKTNRNSRVAPPLPVTYEYVFWNGEGKKKVVYIDTFSKKNFFSELEIGKQYTVFYDEFTNVIVRIEIENPTQSANHFED